MSKPFQLHLYAADRVLYDGVCVSLTIPISDGQLGIMAHRAPMVAAVVPGRLTFRVRDGEKATEVVAGSGIASFAHNTALVLLEDAEFRQSGETT